MKPGSNFLPLAPSPGSFFAPLNQLSNPLIRRSAVTCLSWSALVFLFLSNITKAFAQEYSVLHSFGEESADGSGPTGNLIASGDALYGTTHDGKGSYGTIFRINTDGRSYATLFRCGGMPDAYPWAPLVLSSGRLYCATQGGVVWPGTYPEPDVHGWGSVFSVDVKGENYNGLLQWGALYYWWGWYATGPAGGRPVTGLVLYEDMLYGIGRTPETKKSPVFRVKTNGQSYAIVKELDGWTDASPSITGSMLFGTTSDGGSNNLGSVYAVNSGTGGYMVLKHFTGPDGAAPHAGVVLDGATLYGTTESGGQYGKGTVFSLNTNGTGFKVLTHFAGSDGSFPHADLYLSGSRLCGTTVGGGDFNHGTVFLVQTNGAGFAVLKHFSGTDGAEPAGGVVMVGSALYGTTGGGGAHNQGVVFRLSLVPALVDPETVGTNFCFSFRTVSNLTYAVENNDDLTMQWRVHQTLTGNGRLQRCVIPMTNPNQQFYRVRLN